MDLLEWYNLIFVLPFTGALLYLAMLAAGLSAHGADSDADLDVHAGTDFGVEHGVEVPAAHGHAEAHGATAVLTFLGVGRVPISILLLSLCFLWGFAGWASNRLLGELLPLPALLVASLAIAAASSVLGTGLLARVLARAVPASESYATTHRDLAGRRAAARFEITRASGTARLRDRFGNLLDVPCRLAAGEARIAPGSPVVLLRWDPSAGAFIARLDPIAPRITAGRSTAAEEET